jgi:hypothetical protein
MLKRKAEERKKAIEGKDAAQKAVDKYKEETMIEWMKKEKEAEVTSGHEAGPMEMKEAEAEKEVEIK